MNRRNFILKFSLLACAGGLLGRMGDVQSAPIKWAIPGKVGYVEVAQANAKGRKCSGCTHYKNGLCTLTAIKNANGGGDVHVKAEGFCPMFKAKV